MHTGVLPLACHYALRWDPLRASHPPLSLPLSPLLPLPSLAPSPLLRGPQPRSPHHTAGYLERTIQEAHQSSPWSCQVQEGCAPPNTATEEGGRGGRGTWRQRSRPRPHQQSLMPAHRFPNQAQRRITWLSNAAARAAEEACASIIRQDTRITRRDTCITRRDTRPGSAVRGIRSTWHQWPP